MRKREITPLSEDFLKAFDKRMDVVEEVAEPVQIEEAADLKNDPSHSKNPFKYTKKPTNKKEAQGNVNYWHYVGMASNKEIEDMGEVPANYKSYAKSMMQDAQRELKKFNEEVETFDKSLLEAAGLEGAFADKIKKAFDKMSTEDKAAFTKSFLKNPKAAIDYMFADLQKKSGIKEALDPVGKEDDDVDNDGDTDSSDKYLAKRRAAIGKAIKSDVKEAVERVIAKKGDYTFTNNKDNESVYVNLKGKKIASGDFDAGADGWFFNVKGQNGQKFFRKPEDAINFFMKEAFTVTHKGQPFSYHDTEDEAKKHMEKYAKKGDASSYKVVKESVDLEEANAAKIIADLKAGDSIDVIVQKHLNKKTTKDDILKVIRDYNWKNRKSGGK